jgi:hypothetical protein
VATTRSGIENFPVEAENRLLKVSRDFLVDFSVRYLIRYLGRATDVAVLAEIETISDGCFSYCDSIVSV